MNCSAVRDRIVAWQDGELPPSEHTMVARHLAQCTGCSSLEERLALATPVPFVRLSPVFEAELWRRLDCAIDEEWRTPATPGSNASPPWWARRIEVPMFLLVAYAAVLALTCAWGITNWAQLRITEDTARTVGPDPLVKYPRDEHRRFHRMPGKTDRSSPRVP